MISFPRSAIKQRRIAALLRSFTGLPEDEMLFWPWQGGIGNVVFSVEVVFRVGLARRPVPTTILFARRHHCFPSSALDYEHLRPCNSLGLLVLQRVNAHSYTVQHRMLGARVMPILRQYGLA